MHDLGPATRAVADIVTKITDDQLGNPTPCTEYSLGDVLDHVDGLSLAFTLAARKTPSDQTASGDAGRLPEDWRTRIPERLAELAEAWSHPDAWTGETSAGGVDLEGAEAGLVALNEVIVHGWDLARASGQELEVDDESVATARGFVELFSGPGTEEMRGDAFGPEVPPPPNATPLEQLAALTGRDPRWGRA